MEKYINIYIACVICCFIFCALKAFGPESQTNSKIVQQDSEKEVPRNIFPRVVVSYAIYIPTSNIKPVHQLCLKNLNIFIDRGVFESSAVEFVFSLIGNTKLPDSIKLASEAFRNVRYTRSSHYSVDLYAHGDILREYLQNRSANYYVFLNCGARGPYFNADEKLNRTRLKHGWVDLFLEKFGGPTNVKAVGATISCELHAHVQTYAIALDAVSARLVLPFWSPNKKVNGKNDIIKLAEVGASMKILTKGYNIASLHPMYTDVDFRIKKDKVVQSCASQYDAVTTQYPFFLNPARCDTFNKDLHPLGCFGLPPCDVIFVKYGGEVFDSGLIASKTVEMVNHEDRFWRYAQLNCPQNLLPKREVIDIAKLYRDTRAEILATHSEDSAVVLPSMNGTSEVTAIIVRAHIAYIDSLISFIWSIERRIFPDYSRILIIVLPTELSAVRAVREALEQEWPDFQRSPSTSIAIAEYPAWVYSRFGQTLQELCSKPLRRMLLQSFPREEVARHCDVNSPLHYMLVDLTLHHVVHHCPSCGHVMVTNADNKYSSRFFNLTVGKTKDNRGRKMFDIVMTNMVTKGIVLHVRPERRYVDLGAYVISTAFLRSSKTYFVSSLPVRAQASDFHDADGHFIDRLRIKGARIHVTPEFLFYHD